MHKGAQFKFGNNSSVFEIKNSQPGYYNIVPERNKSQFSGTDGYKISKSALDFLRDNLPSGTFTEGEYHIITYFDGSGYNTEAINFSLFEAIQLNKKHDRHIVFSLKINREQFENYER